MINDFAPHWLYQADSTTIGSALAPNFQTANSSSYFPTPSDAAQKALARRLNGLPIKYQTKVFQEIKSLAPQALAQPKPGLLTINSFSLDGRTFAHIQKMVDRLSDHAYFIVEEDRLLSMSRRAQRERQMQGPPGDVQDRQHLHECLLILSSEDVRATADYVFLLQPDALVCSNIQVELLLPVILSRVINYVHRLGTCSADLVASRDNNNNERNFNNSSTLLYSSSAPSTFQSKQVLPFSSVFDPSKLAEREVLSERISALTAEKQILVCRWLLKNCPAAIVTNVEKNSTVVDTQFVGENFLTPLIEFLTKVEQQQQLPQQQQPLLPVEESTNS